MAGIIPDEVDGVAQRYQQLYSRLTQKNHNGSLAPSSVGSLYESAIGRRYNDSNNKGQIGNGTLTTSQFYSNFPNQDHLRPKNQPIADGSSTYTSVSETSVFKKPMPVNIYKKFNCKPQFKRRLDLLVESLCSVEDKQSLKFSVTTMEILVHTLKNPPCSPPVNPVNLIEYVAQLVKQEYLSKRVPKSLCGSSVVSESTMEEFPDPRVVLQDITQASSSRAQSTKSAQHLDYSAMSRPGMPQPQHQQSTFTGHQTSRLLLDKLDEGTFTASTFNLFNDSEIARRRDEAAAAAASQDNTAIVVPKRGRAVPKSKPPPSTKRPVNGRSKVPEPVNSTCFVNPSNKNISMLNDTAGRLTRTGRVTKPPVQYWNSKGTEVSCLQDPDESVFDQSMTLRNKKVLDKKKSTPLNIAESKNSKTTTVSKPPSGGRGRPKKSGKENVDLGKKTNTSLLPSIAETKNSKTTMVSKPPSGGRAKPKNSGKENIDLGKNPAKKADSSEMKTTKTTKEKTNKKRESANQEKDKIVKKPATKRKSKDLSNTTSKKKKTEDPVLSEEEDDIFGDITYRKPKQQTLKLALSTSVALLSAKKAAGEAEGKATPPCKAIGDFLANESYQSAAMSAAKDAPKKDEVLKRLAKKIEKNHLKPTTQVITKNKVKKPSKEDSRINDILEAVKSSHKMTNPSGTATLTLFRGEEEEESDLTDMEEDEDDDLM